MIFGTGADRVRGMVEVASQTAARATCTGSGGRLAIAAISLLRLAATGSLRRARRVDSRFSYIIVSAGIMPSTFNFYSGRRSSGWSRVHNDISKSMRTLARMPDYLTLDPLEFLSSSLSLSFGSNGRKC